MIILKKIGTNNRIFKKEFLNKDNLLGSAFDADSDGEEGKYYVYDYFEIKDIENINDYFELKPEGNWENKIILVEKN